MNLVEIVTNIPFLSKVFFLCFLVFAFFEILFALLEKELLRKILKPFCLLFLGVAVTVALPYHKFLYIAAYLGMTGDLLLISKRKKALFPLGTFSFLLGHVFYYLEMNVYLLPKLGVAMPTWFHFLYWGLVVVFTFVFFKPIKNTFKLKFFTGLGCSHYYMVLMFSSIMYTIATVGTFIAGATNYMWLSIIGIVFFIASDIFLGYTTYVKDVKRRDFYIMLTYLIAESLIILAFVFTYYGNPSLFQF